MHKLITKLLSCKRIISIVVYPLNCHFSMEKLLSFPHFISSIEVHIRDDRITSCNISFTAMSYHNNQKMFVNLTTLHDAVKYVLYDRILFHENVRLM